MKTVAQVRLISALKVCRNHLNAANISKGVTTMPPPTIPPLPPIPSSILFPFGLPLPELSRPTPTFLSFFDDPCLDLFFRVVEPDTLPKRDANRNYLNQLLPLAWSHNPLTTLKLICNLLYSDSGKKDRDSFYLAASWLHRNHPKTLACNLAAIAGEFGRFQEVLGILYRTLEGKDTGMNSYKESQRFLNEGLHEDEERTKIETMIAMAKKALQRYELDPDYRFLHDRVSDLFAECLKSDIENFKRLQSKLKNKESQSDSQSDVTVNDYCLELTTARRWCPNIHSLFDCTTLLCDSIAKKIFPRSSHQGVEEGEAEHELRALELLMKEVLAPLERPLETPSYDSDTNRWGYHFSGLANDPCPVHEYLEEVKAGGNSKIKAGALLPHEIVEYVNDCDVGQAAELQWKAMVEEVYLKQGKFRNCLAVCDVSGSMMKVPMEMSVGLGLLVSELSEEPWKGKVITFNRKPQLLAIQGNDLVSKCKFVKRMDSQDWHCEVDFRKVFDLILEVAVENNLKAEQVIKKVFVFTIYFEFDEISGNRWETDYEEIQSKFKERGYGNVVPQLVVWNLSQDRSTLVVPCTQPGVTMLSGFISNNLVKSFLDNDGDIGPEQVMEAALSDEEYQSLVVVD